MRRTLMILVVFACVQASFGLQGYLSGPYGPGVIHITGDIWIDAGNMVTLAPGTTFIFDGPYPFNINGTLLAEGTAGDSIVFTTEQSGTSRWRGLRFSGSGSSGSQLAYCLIEKGYATGASWIDSCGGGTNCRDNASPTFTSCTITGNSAEDFGGGVSCHYYSSPSFTNCTMTWNSAYDGGGASCHYYSSPSFTNCTLSSNSAGVCGGAVYCGSSSPGFTNCTLSGNWANGGGGLYCEYSSPVFANCTISANWASWSGAGIYCDRDSSPIFMRCVVKTNTAEGYGGGVHCYVHSAPTFTNCMINGNSTIHGTGGGVFSHNSSPSFTNCTLYGNSAPLQGGGVSCLASSLAAFHSTIIALSTGSGIYFDNSAGSQVLYCDLFGDSSGDIQFYNNDPSQGPPEIGQITIVNSNGDPCDIYKNIFVDPMFADTAAGDFHLTDFSHCIGAGDPADTVSTDFEGNPRPNPSWSYPDIGADEHWSGSPVLHLVVSTSGGNAVLHWTPFGAGPYSIYGASLPFVVGELLDTVSDTTTWIDQETASRPLRYFYYVAAEAFREASQPRRAGLIR